MARSHAPSLSRAQTIDKNIRGISAITKKSESLIQDTLILIHAHITECGDHSGFDRLVAAMGKGHRINSVKRWVETTTHCVWDVKDKKFVKDPNKTMMNVEGASQLSWLDIDGPEKAYVPLNFDAKAKSLKAEIAKARENGDLDLSKFAAFVGNLELLLKTEQAAANNGLQSTDELQSKAA